MNTKVRCFWFIIVCFFVSNPFAFATHEIETAKTKFSPVNALQVMWVFSGIVTSETGENYGYFFQLKREDKHFHATVALIEEESKKVLFHEESDAVIDELAPYDWHVGHAFLKFNTINDSWIFGVKSKNKLGFNFKVDMLKQFEKTPNFHHLSSGVTMLVSQTSELNGHVLLGEDHDEQFVRADDAWFRQIWQDDSDSHIHDLTSVLCQFTNGSSFYSVNLHEPDAQSGSIAGWYDPKGVPQAMSQFIQVSQAKDDAWHIQSRSPHLDLVLSAAMQQNAVVAGFIDGTQNAGFCMLNNNAVSADSLSG